MLMQCFARYYNDVRILPGNHGRKRPPEPVHRESGQGYPLEVHSQEAGQEAQGALRHTFERSHTQGEQFLRSETFLSSLV